MGVKPRARYNLPQFEREQDIAPWLGLTYGELDWFSDRRSLERQVPREALRHYRYHWIKKPSGGVRLIEAPKPRLKEIQRVLLMQILERIPLWHCVHGFRRGRSVRSFTELHTNRHTVLRVDLRDFFATIRVTWVIDYLRYLGYRDEVARTLAGLMTNHPPLQVLRDCPHAQTQRERRQILRRYARPHLPQGAPTSPALANLCSVWLDFRLMRLAETVGAVYTRYGDDMLFSGGPEFGKGARRFHAHVLAIALENGFEVEPRKTRIMRRGSRQHAAGIVLNDRLNIRRDTYDRLKAILHNCIRFGPQSQNRAKVPDFRAHLSGRVGWVESIAPERGRRLREMLRRIEWSPSA